jgi:hypothetical protein
VAAFASVDYTGGISVPIHVNKSFGGRKVRNSLGECVRSYPNDGYDSSLKIVANAEFRLVGPSLVMESIAPILYVFFDAGYYSGFADSPIPGRQGQLASTGAGLALSILGFAELGAYAGYRLIEDIYAPAERFSWDIKFALHF